MANSLSPQNNQGNSIEASVDRYLAPFIQMKDFSGTILIAKNDKILLRKSFGAANYELSVPNKPQTKFQIASLSKTFTAAAIVLLEKNGHLRLDEALSKFIPDFPNGDRIKISHLLSHSAGIPDFYALLEYEDLNTTPVAFQDWIDLLKTKPLDFEPGQNSRYSNSGYMLLAAVIEKSTDEKYEHFLHSQIFKPLKMENTGVVDDMHIISNMASGYDPWIGPQGLIKAPYHSKSVLTGSGSLYSTVDDLYTWYLAIRGEKLFSISELAYPYGWGVRERFGHKLLEQDGSNPGFIAHISAYLAENLCIIALGNIRTGVMTRIKEDLAAIALGRDYEIPRLRKVIKVDPDVLDKYVGRYQVSPSMVMSIKRDGKYLYLKGTGGEFLPLEALSENEFFYRQLYASIVFDEDDSGRVHQLLWDRQYPIQKIGD